MSKKRKTRKEKIRSAERIQLAQSSEGSPSTPVYSFENIAPSQTVATRVATVVPRTYRRNDYTYVVADMRQTLIIVSSLIASSLVLYYLLMSHILKFTMFGY